MKKLLLAGVAALGIAGTAHAADIRDDLRYDLVNVDTARYCGWISWQTGYDALSAIFVAYTRYLPDDFVMLAANTARDMVRAGTDCAKAPLSVRAATVGHVNQIIAQGRVGEPNS